MENDIHVTAQLQGESEQARRDIINTYYSTATSIPRSRSALLSEQSEGRAKIYGIFGGQGNNKNYFEELRTLYATYRPLVQDLLESLSVLLKELSQDERVSDQYDQGLDILSWLNDPEITPSTEYLISAPVSFPLIGVLQLAQVNCVLSALGYTPADLPSMFSGLAGHSQGIVVAAAVSTATTWADFNDAAVKATKILFWIGARCQQLYIETPMTPERVTQLEEEGYGAPTPMLSVTDISLKQLTSCVTKVNEHLVAADRMEVSLINSSSSFVVSGPELTLSGLIEALKTISAKDAQARLPFSKRKPNPAVRFLPITIPCHSPMLDNAVTIIEGDLMDVAMSPSSLQIPVNATADGESLGTKEGPDIVPLLVRCITSEIVNWPFITFPTATHIVDFGPGGISGVGTLAQRALAGTGVRVLIASKIDDLPPPSDVGSIVEVFNQDASSIRRGADWSVHLPALAKTAQGTTMDTKLTKLLGLPPVFVAGMTPTTTHPSFVAAIMNAGFHVELAAGGYNSAESLKSALYSLRDQIPAGRGITINVIYVAPRAIAWQIPLIRSLREEGFPITGMTVGGGVPSVEVATEYITTLGLEHLSLKPGSVAAIHQALDIARQNPSFPIILQWTGGRGGGHHSYEDFHAPIIETYAEIRKCANVCLVAGSGFGCAEDVRAYMNGTWSLSEPYNKVVKMPFDGVLVGSRVMTTLEARTSHGAKQAIASATGISMKSEKDWEQTYKQTTGGILTVISEMGEPIHVVATRGALLWAELDRLVFSLDKSKRAAVLAAKRSNIIKKLNADYQKPWFAGRTESGKWVAGDLEDMTYLDVLKRLAQLMFVSKRAEWIDPSYADFFTAFALRSQERLAAEVARPVASLAAALSSPSSALDTFESAFPESSDTMLTVEDLHYFIHLCRRRGTKPVPFVPALDDNFETWFKKDSLWQSEDLDAVLDQDAERTYILHGPVAASQTLVVDEPVRQVLGDINRGMVDAVLQDFYVGNVAQVKEVEYCSSTTRTSSVATCKGSIDAKDLTSAQLRDTLGGTTAGWRHALFSATNIFCGNKIVENPVWKILNAERFVSATVSDDCISLCQEEGVVFLEITKESSDIFVKLFTDVTGSEPVSLLMKFTYSTSTPYALIQEDESGRNERIYDMYRTLWLGSPNRGDATAMAQSRPDTRTFKSTINLGKSEIQAFNRAIGYHKAHRTECVPVDFAIVAAWKPICAALLQAPVQGDLLALVHLSNGYEMASGARLLDEEEVITAVAIVKGIEIGDSGKTITVECKLLRGNDDSVLTVTSKFLFRGRYTDFSGTFVRTTGQNFELTLPGETELAVLLSKPWFHLHSTTVLDELVGADLEFRLQTLTRSKSKTDLRKIEISGEVYIRSGAGDLTPVATVQHVAANTNVNAVTAYLTRHGVSLAPSTADVTLPGETPSASAVEELTMPLSNQAYSLASGDTNPIHTSALFAGLVDLPGTITHGMYVSAAVRAALERTIAGRNPGRIRSYKVSFVGMVLPGDVLKASFTHESMRNGLKMIKIHVSRQGTEEVVLSGSALVAQPVTTVVFTGQGSQEAGMGMDLYESSSVAREIWDSADAYFRRQFGLSILHIVRENPKSVKVHFGGAKGRLVRKNYIDMYYESPSPVTGELEKRPIFPSVTETSTSFTHTSPKGLLFATQFAQPALTIMELAAFRDMEAEGVVDKKCAFAGHSLGEYAALAAITEFMPFERLLYIVYCRGMTMQLAVERDADGKSIFGMVAVDPGRVGNGCNEAVLRGLVDEVSNMGFFVEIVNLNIRESQYVCAGDLRALDILQKVLDEIKIGTSKVSDSSFALIEKHAAAYTDVMPTEISLKRGLATVPLAGVDVPFHSSFLRPRMEAFRRILLANLDKGQIQPERLVGKYIPNVTGRPFGISRDDCEEIWSITKSERVREVLDTWGEGNVDVMQTAEVAA